MTYLIIFLAIGIWVFGFLVGRNNPALSAVNRLIAAGKAIVQTVGSVVTVIKKS